ncbi:hypothetical protein NXW93_06155 [Parabacteroides distasonis]|nr:hypothetical protein [Parabacteroides distasonis]
MPAVPPRATRLRISRTRAMASAVAVGMSGISWVRESCSPSSSATVPSSDISFCVSRSSADALCASSWHLRMSRLATKASLMYWQCCRTNSPPISM